jgi:hypothetical protein
MPHAKYEIKNVRGATRFGLESDLRELREKAKRVSKDFSVNYREQAEFRHHWELWDGPGVFRSFTTSRRMADFLSGMWYEQLRKGNGA